jgi:hypothetical protein
MYLSFLSAAAAWTIAKYITSLPRTGKKTKLTTQLSMMDFFYKSRRCPRRQLSPHLRQRRPLPRAKHPEDAVLMDDPESSVPVAPRYSTPTGGGYKDSIY